MSFQQAVLRKAIAFAKQSSDFTSFKIEQFCFDKQIDFIRDLSRFKTAVCSRRAGKTISCAADLIDTSINHPNVTSIYISKTRGNSKRIIWKELLHINKAFNLGAKIDNTELSLTFPNNSLIYLTGAKDSAEIDKFRGMALKKVYIDECQSFPSYLKDLVDDVLVPALIDYQGSLILIGTPSPTCAGIFYEASMRDSDYSKHHWTFKDNPFLLEKAKLANPSIQSAQDILDFELRRRKTTIEDPAIGREWLGLWLMDLSLAVYKFDRSKNVYDSLPNHPWEYVIGYDLGFDDADAGIVWAFHKDCPEIYLVDEYKVSKQDISSLASKIKQWNVKYNPIKSVIDTGGLGKKITEELKRRHGFNLEPADKVRKKEYIELMNSDMKLGKIKVPRKSIIASEWEMLVWDAEEIANNRWVEEASFDNHASDAGLYAFRAAYHFLYEEPIKRHAVGSNEWFQEEEDKLITTIKDNIKKEHDPYFY